MAKHPKGIQYHTIRYLSEVTVRLLHPYDNSKKYKRRFIRYKPLIIILKPAGNTCLIKVHGLLYDIKVGSSGNTYIIAIIYKAKQQNLISKD